MTAFFDVQRPLTVSPFSRVGSPGFVLIGLLLVACILGASRVSFGQTRRPNIILIMLDDADWELFELDSSAAMFPNIMKVASDGVSFSNFHVTTPLCGPSRACLYRAQYAHNTGIQVNRPGKINAHGYQGGFRHYREQGYFENDLSTWMKDAGYRTMMVGKFLHSDFERYVPPGWDDFRSYLGARYYGSFVFSNENVPSGELIQQPQDKYRTVAETEDALALIEAHVSTSVDQPFFLNLNTLGPHHPQLSHPTMIENRMQHWWSRISQPFTQAYDQIDVSDKGGFFAQLPRLSAGAMALNQLHYRERALATRSVDDLVGAIRAKLVELEIQDNTYVFVTSDNGFQIGHHRAFGKGVATDQVSRVPCFVVGPNIPAGQVSNHLIAHIDLGPTMTRLAGGTVPDFVDGHTFERLLTPNGVLSTPQHRLGLLIENWASLDMYGIEHLAAAGMTLRLRDEIYTEWANGDREYYDLAADPDQLENRFDQLSSHRRGMLSAWMRVLYKTDQLTTARFSRPFEFNQEVAARAPLKGMADDWDGVKSVRLALMDVVSRKFWNGVSWQDEFFHLDATLANPGGQITEWRFATMPPGSDDNSGRFAAWAWAYDFEGQYAPPQSARFRYDQSAPTILFGDDIESLFTGPVKFSGTTNDTVGANQVRITIENLDNGLYWTLNGYRTFPTDFITSVSSTGAWHWERNLPEGRFQFSAIAVDASGNRSPSIESEFEVRR